MFMGLPKVARDYSPRPTPSPFSPVGEGVDSVRRATVGFAARVMAASRSKKPLAGARARARRPDVAPKRKVAGGEAPRAKATRSAKSMKIVSSKGPDGHEAELADAKVQAEPASVAKAPNQGHSTAVGLSGVERRTPPALPVPIASFNF